MNCSNDREISDALSKRSERSWRCVGDCELFSGGDKFAMCRKGSSLRCDARAMVELQRSLMFQVMLRDAWFIGGATGVYIHAR